MQDTAPSPAPSKSNGSGPSKGPDATASAAAAQRAEAGAASASEAEKSQDAVMGDQSSIDFQRSFKEAAKQLKIDLGSKPDQMPISKLGTLLKLMATGAMKEVEECTDLLEASMTTTAEANKAVVASLTTQLRSETRKNDYDSMMQLPWPRATPQTSLSQRSSSWRQRLPTTPQTRSSSIRIT